MNYGNICCRSGTISAVYKAVSFHISILHLTKRIWHLSMAAADQVPVQDLFTTAAVSSKWYKNLRRYGSCLTVVADLNTNPKLIHQTGHNGWTALHKGVLHGCVKLVRHILMDMFDENGNCKCCLQGTLDHDPRLTRESLLRKPNVDGDTAVAIAVRSGSPKMVILLKWAIDKCKPVNKDLMQRRSVEHDHDPDQDDINEYESYRRISSSSKGDNYDLAGEAALQDNDFSGQIEYPFMYLKLKGERFDERYGWDSGESLQEVEEIIMVPNVDDAGFDEVFMGCDMEYESVMVGKVYSLIGQVLEFSAMDEKMIELMELLKGGCKKNVDFEFAPIEHVFLHFLASLRDFPEDSVEKLWEEVMQLLICQCNAYDLKGGGEGSMLKTLFNLHDPQGRTFLHIAYKNGTYNRHKHSMRFWVIESLVKVMNNIYPKIPSTSYADCLTARNAAGRTIFHDVCIYNEGWRWSMVVMLLNKMDLNAEVLPLRKEDLNALIKWCFPESPILRYYPSNIRAVHLVVLFNSTEVLDFLWSLNHTNQCDCNAKMFGDFDQSTTFDCPLQIAAFLGRTIIVERILQHHTKYNTTCDKGLGNAHRSSIMPEVMPSIHCAAISGQVEAIRTIQKHSIYDPLIQENNHGTALHVIVKRKKFKKDFKSFQILASIHALPSYCKDIFLKQKLEFDEDMPSAYSADEISCINLLLQGRIEYIWTPHIRTKELPCPGATANDEAKKWWNDKVISEVVATKTSINNAANATSVIAALVATASFIGPFQPPLGYADSDGYVRTNRNPVRIYMVCNSLSFFFSVASMLMAVIPAIPMPKESMYDELVRSQRCLKVAAFMLLVSIMCILTSFSSASIAVVSSEWHEKQLVVASIVCGGGICMIVLIVYFIRLLRMLFHRNDRFRRKFAEYMYF